MSAPHLHVPADCPMCAAPVGTPIWSNQLLRIARADEKGFPAFYRVIWNQHVTEFSDLSAPERMYCTEALTVVERALRKHVMPAKINLASLGNIVPHLHWHVIARFRDDSHFPGSVWAAPVRSRSLDGEAEVIAKLPKLERQIKADMRALAVPEGLVAA